MENKISEWVIKWFKANTGFKEEEIKNRVSDNYFSQGWIDSLKFIAFITEMEKKFNIRFSNEEFQDRDFSTIAGLTKILEKKIKGTNGL